jgi:protein subunit release factor B
MCTIEIRPEQGGADALACARSLERAVRAWAARQGWQPAGSGAPGTRAARILLPGVPAAEAG